jgi:capsular polysaccharide biosynthesis protein
LTFENRRVIQGQTNNLGQISFYINMLKRSWWIVVSITLVAANASLLLSYMETPMYKTSTSFVLSPGVDALQENRDILNSFFPLNERTLAITYSEILQSNLIFQEAADFLELDAATRSKFSQFAVVLPESNILELTVSGPNPQIAQALANSVGQISIAYFQNLYQVYEVHTVDEAPLPTEPYSPTPKEDMAIAAFVGFVFGCILAFLREQLLVILRRQ